MDECGVCGGSGDSCALVLSLQSDSLAATSAPMSHPSQARTLPHCSYPIITGASGALPEPLHWNMRAASVSIKVDGYSLFTLLAVFKADLQTSCLDVSTTDALAWE